MHLTRRMRLIWHKLWLIPLVGATADVVVSEAAKLGGVTVPIPWLFSAIGVAGMLGAAVARAYSVPLIPVGLETPDEALTRRSRILGERLGATPVRVFVSDLPRLRGKVDTYLDGHDLLVSKRVAELPEAERDFVLARALVGRGPFGNFHRTRMWIVLSIATCAILILLTLVRWPEAPQSRMSRWIPLWGPLMYFLNPIIDLFAKCRFGPAEGRTWNAFALRAAGNLPAAITAIGAFAETDAQKKDAVLESDALEKWWNTTGQKALEASEWYQRERSLAAKRE